MNPSSRQALDFLQRALRLLDSEGRHLVAARIAMAIDDLNAQHRPLDRSERH